MYWRPNASCNDANLQNRPPRSTASSSTQCRMTDVVSASDLEIASGRVMFDSYTHSRRSRYAGDGSVITALVRDSAPARPASRARE